MSGGFPVIETERLYLRQLRLEDAPAMFHYFSKDEVTEYYDLESFTEVKQAEALIQMQITRYEEGNGFRWGITLKDGEEDRIIGSCGFHNWAKDHCRAEIGYELTPACWRQGIMTEAVRAVTAYGFNMLGLNRIDAFIDPANISSRKLLEKTGFKAEGLLHDYFFEKGRFVDAVIFGQLKRDFAVRSTDHDEQREG